MIYAYLFCVVISIGMLFWLKIYDLRNSISQFITLLIMVVSNLGYYFLATSKNLEEALLAQKVSYIGGVFLPLFYFFMVLEICHVDISRIVVLLLTLFQCILYGLACTMGKSTIYYKSVEYLNINGVGCLQREYGPTHFLMPLSMFIYLGLSFLIVIISIRRKKSVERFGLYCMVIASTLATMVYVVEKLAKIQYEIIPIAYIIMMVGAMIPVYYANLFTVYENREIVKCQLNMIGFITFNSKGRYKGCNTFMANIFPELSNYRLGQKITDCSSELMEIIQQIPEERDERDHIPLKTICMKDSYYDGLIHVVNNATGQHKGYTIILRDETDHYRSIQITEQYNQKLSEEVDNKTKRIRSIQEKTTLGIAQMVESRDLSTGGHIKRTSDVVRIFAEKLMDSEMDFDKDFLEKVVRSAPMHDLGKIGVDDAVLRKQGKYTDEEYEQMKKHSEIGSRMVHDILSGVEEPEFVQIATNVAHYHHEKVNGMGYPEGLKGEEIPIEARIMALADVFDALVSKRCYKDAFSYDKAFSIIENDSGSHFDENLARVFLNCRKELEVYYNLQNELFGDGVTGSF